MYNLWHWEWFQTQAIPTHFICWRNAVFYCISPSNIMQKILAISLLCPPLAHTSLIVNWDPVQIWVVGLHESSHLHLQGRVNARQQNPLEVCLQEPWHNRSYPHLPDTGDMAPSEISKLRPICIFHSCPTGPTAQWLVAAYTTSAPKAHI